MAVKDLIVPGFIGSGTIKYIVTRGFLPAPELEIEPTVVAFNRYTVGYNQVMVHQLGNGSVVAGYGYSEASPSAPASTFVTGVYSNDNEIKNFVVYQLGDGSVKYSVM